MGHMIWTFLYPQPGQYTVRLIDRIEPIRKEGKMFDVETIAPKARGGRGLSLLGLDSRRSTIRGAACLLSDNAIVNSRLITYHSEPVVKQGGEPSSPIHGAETPLVGRRFKRQLTQQHLSL